MPAPNILILCDQHYNRSALIKGELLAAKQTQESITYHTGCAAIVGLEYDNLTSRELPRFYHLARSDRPEHDPDAEAAYRAFKKGKDRLSADPTEAATHLSGFDIETVLVFGEEDWTMNVAKGLTAPTVKYFR